MKLVARCLCLCGLLISLTGCGFQLRGESATVGQSLNQAAIALVSVESHSEMVRAVNQALTAANAQLVSREEAVWVLHLDREAFQQRNLSLTVQARAAEIELTLSIRFSLSRGENILIDNRAVQISRQMLNDPGNVVGKFEELQLLKSEMRRDLAERLVQQVDHSLQS
jgi:LPS-assembly lipoprotein